MKLFRVWDDGKFIKELTWNEVVDKVSARKL
jgi:hypothetical protein